ncbi:hypothetical protein BRUCa_3350 [Brucella melitensis]|nr:Hypothetical protein BSPT2_II1394 [Brucella suis bv. 2]AIB30202.1 hypothetical protein BSSP1_II1399 [Brucella suis bv. 2]
MRASSFSQAVPKTISHRVSYRIVRMRQENPASRFGPSEQFLHG